MKTKICLLALLWGCALSMPKAQSLELDSLETFIHQLMTDFQVPGLSIAIVQRDSVLFAKGYGTRKINQNLPVDGNTLFGIGSISKSFTALALGILVGEGKLRWDDRVVDYLPYFELYAPYVTENFTIRDLLTHRSGLKQVSSGTLWYHSDLSRVEVIKGLKFLKPESGFREKPAYQNVMFVVASEIVAAVSGQSWDAFVQTRIFDHLNMSNTVSQSDKREASRNLAQPHIADENFNKVAIVQEKGDNLAPAGFIYSSANDMAKYMRLLLHDGIFQSDTLIRKEALNELFTPQIVFPIFGPPIQNEFTSYGFGWWLTPKNGHKIIEHSGGIDGMSANLMMVDDLDFGVVVLTNTDEFAAFGLTFKIMEQLLNDKTYDIYTMVKEQRQSIIQQQKNERATVAQTQIKNTRPSLNTGAYPGTYTDKMYGDITIAKLNENELEIAFSHTPLFRGKLTHWHYDTFKIDWYDIRVPDGFITFEFDAKHTITGVRLDQQNLLDVDFSELEINRKGN